MGSGCLYEASRKVRSRCFIRMSCILGGPRATTDPSEAMEASRLKKYEVGDLLATTPRGPPFWLFRHRDGTGDFAQAEPPQPAGRVQAGPGTLLGCFN